MKRQNYEGKPTIEINPRWGGSIIFFIWAEKETLIHDPYRSTQQTTLF